MTDPDVRCPWCQRIASPRQDDRRRKHRTTPDPLSPWCAGSDKTAEETP